MSSASQMATRSSSCLRAACSTWATPQATQASSCPPASPTRCWPRSSFTRTLRPTARRSPSSRRCSTRRLLDSTLTPSV
ncbi:UNVERIFIED_CONTAM: hypothetical protein GTU68_003412 [Idotea baltica]|nr:hypothetical protein [Idotea baltica]